MDNAFCTLNNQTYTAYTFSQLSPTVISQFRRFLQCPSCQAPAFFRKAARNGQAACFGARPHNAGCTENAPLTRLIHGENDDEDVLRNDGQRIVLDLNYGAAEPVNHIDENVIDNGGARGARFIGNGNRPNAVAHRRLRTLLRSLVCNPDFKNSTQILEINGQERLINEFFVQFNQITANYINQFHGYWGQITDIGISPNNGTIWLNSGGHDDVSLCLPPEIQAAFLDRFRRNDAEDLVSDYILYLGSLQRSQNNKYYILINDIAFVSLY
ncbi:hypothetical protein QG083_06685 [Kingella kingae]|uniref:hypothetical protein n=1 Tax=Kingella kingae TaxID=504 RepID=UPI000258690A|nr:hypothetical protein [Kingella kingae]EIC13177.1 hypothetical protein KKB_07589 [Kingella kingae PYKK081]MBD3613338.1 hypothetical protein [Kingella kingae]MBD3631697.1 hypothetical protein [Kingella kingae]MBD3659129.1 hypothetical protein [Kingella kingae]MDK4545445.1 hypothetical protein [Kingella kingae]